MTGTLERIRDAVRFMVDASITFKVDDAGFVMTTLTEPPKRHVLALDKDTPGKELAIAQDPLPEGDYYLINPFAEAIALKSPGLRFLYKHLTTATSERAMLTMQLVLAEIVKSKEIGAETGKKVVPLPDCVIRIASAHQVDGTPIIDLVDAKMIAEFETIANSMIGDFVVVGYTPTSMKASVTVRCLKDPDFETSFGKGVRKKTPKVFLAMVKGLLGIDTPEDLGQLSTIYDPTVKCPPKMITYLSTLLKLQLRYNDALEELSTMDGSTAIFSFDMTTLSEVISDIPELFPVARNIIMASARPSSSAQRPAARAESERRLPGDRPERSERVIVETQRASSRDSLLGSSRDYDRDNRDRRPRYDDERGYSRYRDNDDRGRGRSRYRDDDRDREPRYRDDRDRGGRLELEPRHRSDYGGFRTRRR